MTPSLPHHPQPTGTHLERGNKLRNLKKSQALDRVDNRRNLGRDGGSGSGLVTDGAGCRERTRGGADGGARGRGRGAEGAEDGPGGLGVSFARWKWWVGRVTSRTASNTASSERSGGREGKHGEATHGVYRAQAVVRRHVSCCDRGDSSPHAATQAMLFPTCSF
jgi:hypothetical protein